MRNRMIQSDDFPTDPYGWLTNQCAHGVLGMGAVIAAGLLNNWWFAEPIAAVLISLFYFAISEWALQGLRLFWDSIVDTFHVAMGACLVMAIKMGVHEAAILAGVWAATLGLGVWRRR